MEAIKLNMTYDRCEAVFQFLQECLAIEKPKTVYEKILNVLMWKVLKKFRSKLENNRDTNKCNVSLDVELALAFHEYFANNCPLVCHTYTSVTIKSHITLIGKMYG